MANDKQLEFSPNDATIAEAGRELERWKKVTYAKKQEGTLNFSGNNEATSYSLGKKTLEFKFEVFMSQMRDWENQQRAISGNSELLGVKKTIAVSYANDDLEVCTDVITFVILSQGREVGGGTDGLAYELETLCLGIDHGV